MVGYLDNVPEDKAFLLGDRRLRSLGDLHESLSSLSDEEYSKFAGADFNYFADWVSYVVGHAGLAESLRASIDKDDAVRIVEKAIEDESRTEAVVEQKIEFDVPKEDTPAQKEPSAKQAVLAKQISADEDKIEDVEHLMKRIAKNENEIKDILWKHFAWDLAKEFMYGMAVGILIGFILSRILLR
jgi:hypothetical protein